MATGFTHPSRIDIYRTLHSGPKTQHQIQSLIRLSAPALCRHLAKLVRRGYLHLDPEGGMYSCSNHPHPLGRAFASKALT